MVCVRGLECRYYGKVRCQDWGDVFPGTCFEWDLRQLGLGADGLGNGRRKSPLDELGWGFPEPGFWISVRLCGLLRFKRFLNHGEPQSNREGFDGWFEMPQADPGEGSYRIARWSKTPGWGRPKTDPGEGSNNIAFIQTSWLGVDALDKGRSPCPGTCFEWDLKRRGIGARAPDNHRRPGLTFHCDKPILSPAY